MGLRVCLLAVLAVLVLTGGASAIYLPGVAPKDYKRGAEVQLKVNKIDSDVTQIPYDYYSLPFSKKCLPDPVKRSGGESLGEILMGDRIFNSAYKLNVLEEVKCEQLCEDSYSAEDHETFMKRILDHYKMHWIVDDLPSASKYVDSSGKFIYHDGFLLGSVQEKEGVKGEPAEAVALLHNHVRLTIKLYNMSGTYRIVGVEVFPMSIAAKAVGCSSEQHMVMDPKKGGVIKFTYAVAWEPSNVKWASRWDNYFQMRDTNIHWFSILNSVMIVVFLSMLIAMIMYRTLSHDLTRYNEEPMSADEVQEDTGWKLVHGDVFRPPQQPIILSVLIGTGVHVFLLSLITMVFAVLGFLSPAKRGGLLQAMIILYDLMSVFAGYFSARAYKQMRGQGALVTGTQRTRNMLLAAFLFPGVVFSTLFFLNLIMWGYHSSLAVPFKYLFALNVLWFCVSLPLALFGNWFGFRKEVRSFPVRTNQIPRQVPSQVWYMRPVVTCLGGGVLPFAAVFIELYYIMTSLWFHQFYFMFSFLFIVYVILIITCAEIAVVLCYFQLCSENYRWHWRAFLTSGSSAVYFSLYAGYYFLKNLRITAISSGMLYFGYSSIMVMTFFVLTGTVGYYACEYFTFKIYSAVKVD